MITESFMKLKIKIKFGSKAKLGETFRGFVDF